MELDLEQIAILLQKRYGYLKEIQKLTGEMKEAISRHDEISLALLMDMRGEELAKYDASKEELWEQAAKGYAVQEEMNRLLRSEPEDIKIGEDHMAARIVEIRKKTKVLIEQIKYEEQLMKRQIVGNE